MAKRKNWLLLLVLTIVAAFGICAFAACGATKYSVTWQVSEFATVTVTGYNSAPSEVEEETTLNFKVEPNTGYEVSSVSVNDRKITADKSGNYVAVVKSDMVIKVETVEKVSSVTVKTNPTKMVYYAGEELDKTGMVVEVEYGSGRKANETEYTVTYKNGGAFALGDTSFTVKYKGVESAAVNLDATVEVKVEIDPASGKIADEYYTGLQANTDLKNINKSDKGVISFTYSELNANIALPTADQWSRGEDGDYIFVDWGHGGATEIAKTNDVSISFTAKYKPILLELTSIRYENQTVEEETVPYLIIAGYYRVAKTAYLYLYEGNDKVELVGDSVGSESTQRGDEFELKFDMRKLVEKEYVGKWMDIKFVAVEGDNKETQEIDLNDYDEDFVNKNQIIVNGDYSYSFAVYTPDNSTAKYLKAVYSNYFKNEYTMTAGIDNEGNATLTINGVVAEKWAGDTVCIDFEGATDGTDAKYCVVGADGSYTVTFNLKDYKLTTNGYAHFRIVESEANSSNVLYKDGDGNLLNAGCVNNDLETMNVGLIENQGAIRVSNEKETAVFYVGRGKWGGIVIYGKNEAIATTAVTLETKDEKPMLVVKGTFVDKFTAEEVVAYLKAAYAYADLQNNAADESNSTNRDWGTPTELSWGKAAEGNTPAVPATMFVEAADGAWKIYLDLSARENAIGELLFSHFGSASTNLECTSIDKNARITATIDETQVMYALEDFTAWGGHVVSIKVRTPIDFVKTTTKVELESANGKAYLVISGTYTGKAEDGIEELTLDLNTKRNDVQSMNSWAEKKFSKDLNNAEVTVADGKWAVKIDLTSLKLESGNNLAHFLGSDLDLTLDEIVNAENEITVGVRKYVLETQNHWDRDFVIIVVSVPETSIVGTAADIVVADGKVLVKVSGTYDKVTEDIFKALIEENIAPYYDIQKNPQADHGTWDGEWTAYSSLKIDSYVVENGTFTISYDVTDCELYAYTMHLGRKADGGAADFKLTDKIEKRVQLGGKTYLLINFPGSGNAHEYYGCVGLKITDAE